MIALKNTINVELGAEQLLFRLINPIKNIPAERNIILLLLVS